MYKEKGGICMKKIDFWFLLRFVIITPVYVSELFFLGRDFLTLTMVLDPLFFPFMLVLYLTAIVASLFFERKTVFVVKIISDVVFILLFAFQNGFLLYWGLEDIGDSGLACVGMMLCAPMNICFIIWLIRDLRFSKSKGDIGRIKFNGLYPEFFLRLIIVVALYYVIDHFFPFILFMNHNIFIFVLIIYGFTVFMASWFEETSVLRLQLISDIAFLGMFTLQILCMMYYLYMESSKAYPRPVNMIWLSPFIIFFVICLVWDIKRIQNFGQGQNQGHENDLGMKSSWKDISEEAK